MDKMWEKVLIIFTSFHCANLLPQTIIVPSDEPTSLSTKQGTLSPIDDIVVGACTFVIHRVCPDKDVSFYLYSKQHQEVPEGVRIGADSGVSNLTETAFDPALPTKIILHGYDSDMYLHALVEIKKQYFIKSKEYNIFFVDWARLAKGPALCYPAAVHNTKHVGQCTAQLVERIRELGNKDIHLIGFSLGGQLTNFVANALRPYQLPRITGLDPAGPGFITSSTENKLDKGDAKFVDVIHTNALVQGTIENSGHVDFFLNGGATQPGCWAENSKDLIHSISGYFACNHYRAALYFAESITTGTGFYGWPCPSYLEYLFGNCLPKEPQIIMGDLVNATLNGVHLVITNSVSPFAVGKFTGPAIEVGLKSERNRLGILENYKKEVMIFFDADDLIESLYESRTKARNRRRN